MEGSFGLDVLPELAVVLEGVAGVSGEDYSSLLVLLLLPTDAYIPEQDVQEEGHSNEKGQVGAPLDAQFKPIYFLSHYYLTVLHMGFWGFGVETAKDSFEIITDIINSNKIVFVQQIRDANQRLTYHRHSQMLDEMPVIKNLINQSDLFL